jgi:hypothetical protein
VCAAAVGLSRLAGGVHWPSDVLGGWLLASTVVAAAFAISGALAGKTDDVRAGRPGQGTEQDRLPDLSRRSAITRSGRLEGHARTIGSAHWVPIGTRRSRPAFHGGSEAESALGAW